MLVQVICDAGVLGSALLSKSVWTKVDEDDGSAAPQTRDEKLRKARTGVTTDAVNTDCAINGWPYDDDNVTSHI